MALMQASAFFSKIKTSAPGAAVPHCWHPFLTEEQREACGCIVRALRLPSRGFLLADGTGCGKTRTMAVAAKMLGAPVLWVTVNKTIADGSADEIRKGLRGHVTVSQVLGDGADVTMLSYAQLGALPSLPAPSGLAPDSPWPVVVLDEFHTACAPSNISYRRCDALIHSQYPNCGVIFSSATPPSDFRNLSLLRRLGAMEIPRLKEHGYKPSTSDLRILCMDLKVRGLYLSRHLSRSEWRVERRVCCLSATQESLYDGCVGLLLRAQLEGSLSRTEANKCIDTLLLCCKMEKCVAVTRELLASGRSVVITLRNVWQKHSRQMGASLLHVVLRSTLEAARGGGWKDALPALCARADEVLGPHVPLATRLRESLGRDDAVADATGDGGSSAQRTRGIRDFQSGKSLVILISKASSMGLSLHATGPGQRPRTNVVLQIPGSAQDFAQQCGRVHRLGQGSTPRFLFVSSNVPSERRCIHRLQRRVERFNGVRGAEPEQSIDSIGMHGVGPKLEDALQRVFVNAHMHALLKAMARCGVTHTQYTGFGTSQDVTRVLHQFVARYDSPMRLSKALLETVRTLHRIQQSGSRVLMQRITQQAATLVRLCVSLIPEAQCWQGIPWSPQRHHEFPSFMQDKIGFVLEQSCSTNSRLHALPTDVVHRILSTVPLDEFSANPRLLRWWTEHVGVLPAAAGSTNFDSLLASLVMKPVAYQEGVMRLIAMQMGYQWQHRDETSPDPRNCVAPQRYPEKQNAEGISVCDYVLAEHARKSLRVKVTVELAPSSCTPEYADVALHAEVLAPPLAQWCDFEHRQALYLFVCRNKQHVYACVRDGDVLRLWRPGARRAHSSVRLDYWDAFKESTRLEVIETRDGIDSWNTYCRRLQANNSRLAWQLSKVVYVVTAGFLQHWKHSKRTIIKHDDLVGMVKHSLPMHPAQ